MSKVEKFQHDKYSSIISTTSSSRDSMLISTSNSSYYQFVKSSRSSKFANDQLFIKLAILKIIDVIRESKNENESTNAIKLIRETTKDLDL